MTAQAQTLTPEAIEVRRQHHRNAYRRKATLRYQAPSIDDIVASIAAAAAAELVEVPGRMAELRDVVRPWEISVALGKHPKMVYRWITSGVIPAPDLVLIGSPGRRTGYDAAVAERIATVLGDHFSRCAYLSPKHEITKRRIAEAVAQ